MHEDVEERVRWSRAGKTTLTQQYLDLCQQTLWRNGSASDSRSEGCVFNSRQGQWLFFQLLDIQKNLDYSWFILIQFIMFCDYGDSLHLGKKNT